MVSKKKIKPGDEVSILACQWGQDAAKEDFGSKYRTGRYVGVILDIADDTALCNMAMPDGSRPFEAELPLKHLTFEKPAPIVAIQAQPADTEAPAAKATPAASSSTTEAATDSDSEGLSSDEEEPASGVSKKGMEHAQGWTEIKHQPIDPRVQAGYGALRKASISIPDPANASHEAYLEHVLPMDFFKVWAAAITKAGMTQPGWSKKWVCTVDDLMHWHGCWVYMMCFPELGDSVNFDQ